jgi:hypothetical protein
MRRLDRDGLAAAWSEAGLPEDELVPVLELYDAGAEGPLRVEGERLHAELIQPLLDWTYAEAREVGGTRDQRESALEALEERRRRLYAVHSLLRHAGAIADVPARDPKMTVQTAARRAGR